MFKKIKSLFSKEQSIVNKSSIEQDFATTVRNYNNSSSFNDYDRGNYVDISDKMNGYQYIAADIVAKTCASQKIRLYAKRPTGNSRNHAGKKEIMVKNVPVRGYRKSYLMGETELSHDDIRYKTLSAEESIVEILDHPSIDILRDINPYSNQWEFLYTLTMAMQFYGNSYFEKIRFTNGDIAELWYAPPQIMKIIQGKTFENFISHYEWGECYGTPKIIQREDMLDFKMPGIGDSQVYGTSKIQVAWKYINLIDSSLAFQKSITDNTGRPDIMLIAENAGATAEDLIRLENKWNDRFYGPEQAGKMSTIPGKVKVEVLPRSEFNFDNDTSLVRAIARGFGLPEYKVLPSSAIKANDSTQEKDFMKETIDSYLTLIEEVLNQNYLSEWDSSGDLFFAFDPVIKEDLNFKLDKQVKLSDAGLLTYNEAREQDGLPPVEGGDDARYKGQSIISKDNSITASTVDADDKPEEDEKSIRDDISKVIKKMSEMEPKKEIATPPIQFNFAGADIEIVEEEEPVKKD